MWLLESDGSVFLGKRLWLRPGKKYLLGRNLSDADGFVIENKTISRKHLVIEVGAVEAGDGIHLETRSAVILEDLKTKIGTQVDGRQIRGERHALGGDSHEIILGHYEHSFKITWKPVVLSFSFSPKELKGKPVESLCQQFEGLDIKIMLNVVRGTTTHLVAKKRNTPKVLEALINGCFIVEQPFVNAVAKAAEQPEDGSSLLETDFDVNWPDALNYLPPRGKEPVPRPNRDFYPNPSRHDVFDGYTFIFYEQAQFDTLLGPITCGQGKALLYQAQPRVTTVEDFARYVKNAAGEKGLGEFDDGSEGKGVVVVKYQPAEGPNLSWYSDFGTQVSLQLDHRLILQNEFLDAILSNDASELRKPLEIEESSTGALTVPAATQSSFAVATLRRPAPSTNPTSSAMDETSETSTVQLAAVASTRRGRTRRTVTSRFKGFDNELSAPMIPGPSQAQPTPTPISQSQESGMFVSQDQDMELNRPLTPNITNYGRSNRKRLTPPLIDEGDEDDFLDQLAPGAANLKRIRLAEDVARRRRGESPPQPIVTQKAQPTKPKTQKPKERLDVLEVARQQREKEDERARAERESLQQSMGDMEIDEIRKLAHIEEMEVTRPAPPPRTTSHADDSDRWDERWNGRKNFKKFRRRGETGVRAVNKVIVILEEVKTKDFGIGAEYWLEGDNDTQPKKKKGKGRARDMQTVSQAETQTMPARHTRGRTAEMPEDSDLEVLEEALSPPRTATQRASAPRPQAQKLSDKTRASVNLPKRAAEPLANPVPAKRARPAPRKATAADSDDSDDGLGFKFRKRK